MHLLRREGWILLAISVSDEGYLTLDQLADPLVNLRVRCSDEVGPDFYRFSWQEDGPSCKDLVRDCERLERAGLIENVALAPDGIPRYGLTPDGFAAALPLFRRASSHAVRCLRNEMVMA